MCFQTGIIISGTRSFHEVGIGSDYSSLIITFKLHPDKSQKSNQIRMRFDIEKTLVFGAIIGGRFVALTILGTEAMNADSRISTFHNALT